MTKITVVLDCKVGKNVAGDTVALDEKLAKELISIGRATEVEGLTLADTQLKNSKGKSK